ncbi:condensation domain-containing protein [uncultured Sphingomonas sp.]|uniref:non-ribosomal peptide synthetase n=1 Tax=uncultured Sphingomonas sp. TaxID=158754 RepID=UPI0025F1BBBA|nr:condensation domain-containing protein [uncultured Sphingomonas sp.]
MAQVFSDLSDSRLLDAGDGTVRARASREQRRLWFLAAKHPGETTYHMAYRLDLCGAIDAERLRRAIAMLQDRHETLRTRFEFDGETLFQRVETIAVARFEVIDAPGETPVQREAAMTELAEEFAAEPIPLDRAPLFRCRLIQWDDDRAALIFVMHHVIGDGWSHSVLTRDFCQAYLFAGKPGGGSLPPLDLQFADFAEHQHQAERVEVVARQVRHWANRLAGYAPLHLPIRPPQPHRMRARHRRWRLDPVDAARLDGYLRSRQALLSSALLTAYQRALALMSGQNDFFLATVVANRRDADVAEMIGFFANTLLLPSSDVLTEDHEALLLRNQALMIELQEHQEAPLDDVINALNLAREVREDAPIEALFVVQNAPFEEVRIADVQIEVDRLRVGEAKVPVTLFATQTGGTLDIEVEYDPVRVSDQFATDLLQLFREELAALAGTSPGPRDIQSAILAGPAAPERLDATVVDLIWRRGESQPDAIALVTASGTLRYSELLKRADQVACGLVSAGARAGERIATLLPRDADLYICLLGILRAAMIWAPLDPEAPQAYVEAQLASLAPSLVIVPRDTTLRPGGISLPALIARGAAEAAPAPPRPTDIAYAITTSGSSGDPKIVLVGHAGLANVCGWIADTLSLQREDAGIWKTTMVFDAVFRELFPPLIAGGRLVIAPPDAQRDMQLLREQIVVHGVSTLHCVPSQLRAFLREGELPVALRAIVSGGEPLPVDLAHRVLEQRSIDLYNVYGPTEATVDVTFHRVTGRETGTTIPIGLPIPNVQIALTCGTRLLPASARGEISIGGCAVAHGYLLGDPAQRFCTIEPLGSAYRTGDLGSLNAQGALLCEGRIDRQIKVNGVRIEPGLVEAALRAQPGVADAEVVVLNGERSEFVGFLFPDASMTQPDGAKKPPAAQPAWRAVFDDSYDTLDESIDPRDNTAGWMDSATRTPIPPAEVLAMMDDAAAKICRWQPKHVLELGCGIGTLAFRLIDSCESFLGVDFAASAIQYCQHHAAALRNPLVRFEIGSLENFELPPGRCFDAIVLNSVLQYLPDRAALDRLLDRLAPALADDGFLFLGDIRDARLQDLHAFWKLRERRGGGAQCQELLLAALSERFSDEELLLHPDDFCDWAFRNGFAAPLIEHKMAGGDNELVNFRFDVTLCRARPPVRAVPSKIELRPNVPVLREANLLRCATSAPGGQSFARCLAEDGEAKRMWRLPEPEPDAGERLCVIVQSDPRRIAVHRLPASASLAECAATFGYRSDTGGPPLPTLPNPNRINAATWRRFLVQAGDAPRQLRTRLPQAMLPHRLIPLPYCPRLANGKKNLGSLVRIARADGRSARVEYPAPGSAEEKISRIFQQLLGTRFALDDDFFALGGSSLLATQARNRVEQTFGISIPLRALFENTTPRLLAREVARGRKTATAGALARIEGTPPVLSYAQRRLWFIERMGISGPVYNIAHAVRLSGLPDLDALDRAVGKLCRRHVPLRSTFFEQDGEPQLRIAPPRAVGNIELLPDTPSIETAIALLDQEQRKPFDLEQGPLLRTLVLPIHGGETILCLICHHIISDGWSMGIALAELSALYAAARRGEEADLPAHDIDYIDLAIHDRQSARQETFAQQIAYWQRELADAPPRIPLPFDHLPHGRRSWSGGKIVFTIASEIAGQLERFAQETRATPFMVLLAAFHLVLRTRADTDDTVIGTVLANRNRMEAEHLVGFLVNPLALRIVSRETDSFRALVEHTRDVALRGFEHQDVPFDMLLEHLPVERSADYQAVFQVLFALQNNAEAKIVLGDLEATRLRLPPIGAMFDLSLEVRPTANGFRAELEYASELFERRTAEHIAQQFEHALRTCLARPEDRIADLDLLPDREREQLLAFGRGDTVLTGADDTICSLFEQWARREPDRHCMRDGDQLLSYGAVLGQATALADQLLASGCSRQAAVAIALPRGPQVVIAMLAIQWAGAVPCYVDPAYPAGRRRQLLALARCHYCITATNDAWRIERLETAPVAGSAALGDTAPHPRCAPEDPAFLAFTSGTTGVPKVVKVSHRAVCARLVANDRVLGAISGEDCFAHCYSFNYDGGLVCAFWPLTRGTPIRFVPLALLSDAAALGRFCHDEAISIFDAIPLVVATLIQSPVPLPALRLVVTGGDTCPPDLLARQRAAGIDADFANQYGPCEAVFNATTSLYEAGSAAADTVTIGHPIPGCDIVVVDAQGALAPIGVFGEIWIGGPYLSDGYLDAPPLQAEKFADADFFGERQRFFCSGDRGRWLVSGELEFGGRIDRQVQINGMRVEPAEVEAALMGLPEVTQAVVAVLTHEGTPTLSAFIVPRRSSDDFAPMTGEWQTAFDDLYAPSIDPDGPVLDFSGWTETATGDPIPVDEMRAWLEDTLAVLKGVRHDRVLEIGCGLGLIALSLADQTETYVATDISSNAIAALDTKAAAKGITLRTLCVPAHAVPAALPGETFDLIILNSVVQYLSGHAELSALIASLTPRLSANGAIFVGDVRDLRRRDLFYTLVERARTPGAETAAIHRRALQARLQDEEAHFHPLAFTAIASRCGLAEPTIRYKPLDIDNEMINFRFDALLHRTASPNVQMDALAWQASRAAALIERVTAAVSPLALEGVPFASSAGEGRKSTALRNILSAIRARGWHAAIFPDLDDPALCTVTASPDPATASVGRRVPIIGDEALPQLSNQPDFIRRASAMRTDIQAALEDLLPAHMVPPMLVFLDTLPIKPGGKVDESALRHLLFVDQEDANPSVDDDLVTAAMTDLWRRLLKVDALPIDADFFAFGGHSLLATRLVAEIAREFGVRLPVVKVFELRTLRRITAALRGAGPADPSPDAPTEADALDIVTANHHRIAAWNRRIGSDASHFGVVVKPPRPVAAATLARAADLVAARHPILRWRFGPRSELLDLAPSRALLRRHSAQDGAAALDLLEQPLRGEDGAFAVDAIADGDLVRELVFRARSDFFDGTSLQRIFAELLQHLSPRGAPGGTPPRYPSPEAWRASASRTAPTASDITPGAPVRSWNVTEQVLDAERVALLERLAGAWRVTTPALLLGAFGAMFKDEGAVASVDCAIDGRVRQQDPAFFPLGPHSEDRLFLFEHARLEDLRAYAESAADQLIATLRNTSRGPTLAPALAAFSYRFLLDTPTSAQTSAVASAPRWHRVKLSCVRSRTGLRVQLGYDPDAMTPLDFLPWLNALIDGGGDA